MKDEADGLHTYTYNLYLHGRHTQYCMTSSCEARTRSKNYTCRSRLSLSCLLCNADALGLVLYSLPTYVRSIR